MGAAVQAHTPCQPQRRVGAGLRFPHLADWLAAPAQGLLLEVHTENLFGLPAAAHQRLASLRERHAFSLHGVGLSLGSADGLDATHLAQVAEQVRRYEPQLVSEHLAWNRIDGISVPDLLPLPYTHETLALLCAHVQQVQDTLQRPLGIENISAYLLHQQGDWAEVDFLIELARRTGCTLLVDVNNLHVNQLNHGSDPLDFLRRLPPGMVSQWHLGGPTEVAGAWIDTHASTVPEPVWSLYAQAQSLIGPRPTIVEWDQDLPPLSELLALVERAAHTAPAPTAQPGLPVACADNAEVAP